MSWACLEFKCRMDPRHASTCKDIFVSPQLQQPSWHGGILSATAACVFRIGRVHVCSRFLNCSICILRPCLLPHRLAPELLPSPCVGSSMPIFSCGDQCRLMAAHVALLNPRCDSCSLCGACLKRPAAVFRDTWATDSDKSPES